MEEGAAEKHREDVMRATGVGGFGRGLYLGYLGLR